MTLEPCASQYTMPVGPAASCSEGGSKQIGDSDRWSLEIQLRDTGPGGVMRISGGSEPESISYPGSMGRAVYQLPLELRGSVRVAAGSLGDHALVVATTTLDRSIRTRKLVVRMSGPWTSEQNATERPPALPPDMVFG